MTRRLVAGNLRDTSVAQPSSSPSTIAPHLRSPPQTASTTPTDIMSANENHPPPSQTEQENQPLAMVPTSTSPLKTVIHASILIRGPASSPPLKNRTIVIEDKVITHIMHTDQLPSDLDSHPSTTVPVLMPGLWDCHCHLLGNANLNLTEFMVTPAATCGARLVPSLKAIVESGVTSVRDLGSHALEVAKAVEEGAIPGPNIYSAGAAISQTAGHADLFDMPFGFVHSRMGVSTSDLNNHEPGRVGLVLADGIDEVRKAVRLQIRRGAKVIKFCASGGVLSISDDPIKQQFSIEEMKVFVDEAERLGRIVAAHCHGKPGIMAALEAGVKTIEHGTYIDEECIKKMKEKGAILCPTRTIVKVGVDHPELMGKESYQKMVETAKYHLGAYQACVKGGVKIALGTDLGVSRPDDHVLSLGKSGQELVYAVKEAGMSEAQAIEAMTANGPLTLGNLGMAPKSGQIEVGYDGDVIGLTEDPTKNIDIFMGSKGVSHVWKGGNLMKGPA